MNLILCVVIQMLQVNLSFYVYIYMEMATGFYPKNEANNEWYYFDETTGERKTGWVKYNNKDSYLYSNDKLQKVGSNLRMVENGIISMKKEKCRLEVKLLME